MVFKQIFKCGQCVAVLLFTLLAFPSVAQNNETDSLRTALKHSTDDTNKVNTLNALADNLWKNGQYDTAITVTETARVLGEQLGFKKGAAVAYTICGIIYEDKGDLTKAMEAHQKALNINTGIGYDAGIARNLYEIGIVYDEENNYAEALEHYIKASALFEKLHKRNSIANCYNEIGNVYNDEGDYPNALEFYLKALSINREMDDKSGMAARLNNLGTVYHKLGNYPKAIECDSEGNALYSALGNKHGVATALGNLGTVYHSMGEYDKSLNYHLKSLDIFKEMGAKNGISMSLVNIGDVYADKAVRLGKAGLRTDSAYKKALNYFAQALSISRQIDDRRMMSYAYSSTGIINKHLNNYNTAYTYLDSALRCGKSIGEKESIAEVYMTRSALDSVTGNYKDAYRDYMNYIKYRDSLINEENTKKTVRAEMNFQFEQQQAADKATRDKEAAVAEQDRKKQVIIRNSLIAGFLLMIALAFFIFRGLRQKQKANIIITKQKEEVEKQKELVEQQKAIVDEKNKDITDSIHYASRIQCALLTTDEYIGSRLKDFFILFKPRDIVSGDFYWAYEDLHGVFHIACCDCTGHGVPGAFMSLLNISMLNETVIERKITWPDLILNDLRTHIIKALNPKGLDTASKDGMDCSYCAIDIQHRTVNVACANNPIWIIRADGSMEEPKPDKMPVGMQYGSDKPFTLHTLPLNAGDCIYMYTDGYADQFGGPKGKKFKYKQLQQLIMDNAQLTMEEQRKILDKAIEEWKGSLEQVDDILIIGIRV